MLVSRIAQLHQQNRYTGGRKLQLMLMDPGNGLPVMIGRDHLFRLTRQYGLQAEYPKRYKQTSNSKHRYPVYPNLLKGNTIDKVNQAWVCDITYLRLHTGKFCYLFLVTDLASRKIIGYELSQKLDAEGAVKALKMALRKANPKPGFIHHSDHGVQYCCKEYRRLLSKHGARISMTGEDHCYDNAVAERLNGTLKQEYGLGSVLASFEAAQKLTDNGILLYNTKRLHQNLRYSTPDLVYNFLSDYPVADATGSKKVQTKQSTYFRT
jgi:transposase InsO family protein